LKKSIFRAEGLGLTARESGAASEVKRGQLFISIFGAELCGDMSERQLHFEEDTPIRTSLVVAHNRFRSQISPGKSVFNN
jgi:hypothetical protein